MIKANCDNCNWQGSVEKLKVEEDVDHEVWTVFNCPECNEEYGRQLKART